MSLPFPPSIPIPGCFGSLVPLRGPSPLGSPRSPDLGSLRRARGRARSLGFIPGGAGPASSSRSHICSWNCNLRRWLGWAPAGSGSGRKALGEARGSRRAGGATRRGRLRGRAAAGAAGHRRWWWEPAPGRHSWSEKVVAGRRGPQPVPPLPEVSGRGASWELGTSRRSA